MNFAALAYLTTRILKRPALESARLRIVRYASANKVAYIGETEGLTMNEKKDYCVTAINRLTGEREIISAHLTKSKAEQERARLIAIRPEKRPYIYPLTAAYPKQLNLFTKDLDV